MEPEERIYAALSGQKPDRIPPLSLALDPNIINQVLGLPTVPALQRHSGASWRNHRSLRFVRSIDEP